MESMIESVREAIDDSNLGNKGKNKFRSIIGNWGGAGPVARFKNFLATYDLIPESIGEDQERRIKYVNGARNSLVHRGTMRMPRWVDDEHRNDAAYWISSWFIPYLVEEHLNRSFNLSGFTWVDQNTDFIKEYIEYGTWDGREVERGQLS